MTGTRDAGGVDDIAWAGSLEERLRGLVGTAHVLVDPDLRAPYETDWTGRFRGTARCVVRPASTDEVAAVMHACAEAGAPMIPQGGNTGLVGGGVPGADPVSATLGGAGSTDVSPPIGAVPGGGAVSIGGGQVVISLTRLTDLDPVDELSGQVVAGAGVTLERLAQHARAVGLDFGVDLAARSAATVGGLIATNAGGVRVLRHGSMRAQIAGVEAVTARGEIVSRLAGLAKDNTGYDLDALLCGSEGTLAIITKARLRLTPLLAARAVALVGVDDTAAALSLTAAARRALPSLSAVEIFFPEGLELVRAHARLGAPLSAGYGAYVLLEASAADTDPTGDLLDLLSTADAVRDATVASDAAGCARLWAYRESQTEAINTVGAPVKLDVCVPLPALSDLVAELPDVVRAAAPGARAIVFGHLNEGNLHVNVLDAGDGEAVTDAVLRLVASHRGSISSEHGVGRAKARWLELSRAPAEIAMMRAIKSALDPAGLLNPGALFG